MLSTPVAAVRSRSPRPQRRLAALLAILSATAVACGGGAAAEPQVASLDSVPTASATESSVSPADSQEALLAFAACMRENGVEMADPTFDADGNAQGGLGIGPDSGIDPRSDAFQTAQEACGGLIEGLTLGGPGGGQGGGLDRDALQTAFADFTACLRDEGLEVDDLTLGGPGGGQGGPPAGGTFPDGAGPDGSIPGGFQGGPPPGGAGGDGFDPTSRLVEQLGLDAEDPAVAAALDVCQPVLQAAFQPADGSTEATG
jgi:hypothetical protein